MADRIPSFGRGDMQSLILQFLVRKLIEKSILSPADVRDLLVDAATHLDVDGGQQTPQAARTMVEEDLAPAFLSGISITSDDTRAAPSQTSKPPRGNNG